MSQQAGVDGAGLRRWRNAICLAFLLGGITVTTWGPRLPAVIDELEVGTRTVGWLLGCVAVGSIVGLLAASPFSNRLGARWGLLVATCLIALALVTMGLAIAGGSVRVLAAAFLVVGFGIGLLDVLINVEGAAVEVALGKTVMPLMHGLWSVGAAVGAGIGAGCAFLGVSPTGQFLAVGVLAALLGALIARAVPGGRHGPQDEGARSWRRKVAEWARGWVDPRLLLIGVVMLGVELAEGSANNWLTLAVNDDHGEPAATAAAFFVCFAVTEAATRIFGGPAVDRLGRVTTIRLTTLLGVAGLVLFIVGGPPVVVLLGVALWAVGVSMGFPLGMSAAAESGPNPAARVSVVASIGYIANLAGPPAIGLLAASAGLLNSFWLIVALMAAAFAAAPALGRRQARR